MSRRSVAAVSVTAACLVFASAAADDSAMATVWSSGLEYSTGTYGGDDDIEEIYIPVGVTLNFPRVALDVAVPYLSVRGPAGSAGDDLDSGETVTESGLGDIIAGITVYDVAYSDELGLALDLSARIKFGTADVDKGLGTGEQDITFRADFYKFFEQFTLLGSIGYKFRGAPEGVDLQDVPIASIGGSYYPGDRSSFGLFYDYRESAIPDSDAISELTATFARRLNDSWTLQLYVFTGFTESSSDWGGGLSVIVG